MSGTPSEAEQLRRLERSLRRMPVVRREIFLAVRLDAMSYPDIAEVTGISVERIEREFAAALHAIDDALEGRRPSPWWRRFARRIAAALGR